MQREIGEIESIEENIFGSADADEKYESQDMWQFDVKGTKGSGKIFVESPNVLDELRFTRRILETSNGEFDLGPTPDDYQPIYEDTLINGLRELQDEGTEQGADVPAEDSSDMPTDEASSTTDDATPASAPEE